MTEIAIKRIYEQFAPTDGYRILVDRLWPRGVSKEAAQIDLWYKEAAPSSELRKWFNHQPEKWAVFSEKYTEELKANHIGTAFWERHKNQEKITLLFANKDIKHTHALILLSYLKSVR